MTPEIGMSFRIVEENILIFKIISAVPEHPRRPPTTVAGPPGRAALTTGNL
jgi:hypothetical protein